jgi:hypothetical protein
LRTVDRLGVWEKDILVVTAGAEPRSGKFNAKLDFMRDELTFEQQRFVTEYLTAGNATEAARRAGYKRNDVTLAAVDVSSASHANTSEAEFFSAT